MKSFLVHTIADTLNSRRSSIVHTVPAGSGIWVDKVLKRSYRGIWFSAWGSYNVTVPKTACVKADQVPMRPGSRADGRVVKRSKP